MTEQAKKTREYVLRTAHAGGDANLQSIFSSIEIMQTLYNRVLHITPATVDDPNRDRFVLSKGQSTMGLLAILAQKGFFPLEELFTACRYNSRISMQADRTKLPGVEISAGSLGHGFPIAAGIAWGNKIQGAQGRVFVLAGDGEMNEGTMWEAALFASSEKLDNLTLIIDDNDSVGEMIAMGSLEEKLRAFGFTAVTVDGHNEDALEKAMCMDHEGKPLGIVAKTVRGYGCRTLMTDRTWFHRAPNDEELQALLLEVENF